VVPPFRTRRLAAAGRPGPGAAFSLPGPASVTFSASLAGLRGVPQGWFVPRIIISMMLSTSTSKLA
jgi:hypothetical protein